MGCSTDLRIDIRRVNFAALLDSETTSRPVLVVDDDPNDVFLLQRALARWGIKAPVQIVKSGRECIDYLTCQGPFDDRRLYPVPVLVLLDLKMPGMDGCDVLKWIREQPQFEKLCVVLLTSTQGMDKCSDAQRVGATAILVKPMDYSKATELQESIQRLLASC
ncbi:MAG TPA: response regulator [Verrucomicrobiae bacterium]|nr:response regulator [Verrucomicrobiae bacterium]